MGIKLLNKFLAQNYVMKTNTDTRRHLSNLRGKKICVDISIYLHLFKRESENWLSQLYRMCVILRHHGINPIFVFDGFERKDDKIKTLDKRREVRHLLFEKIEYLESKGNITEEDEKEMKKLKKKVRRPNRDDISKAKELLEACGLPYIQPQGEADEVCIALVNKNIVYACLSNDTDMFAYGCKRIMKNFSLQTHSVDFYNLDNVVCELNINKSDFQILCVLSGTDYNFTDKNIFHFYRQYAKYFKSNNSLTFLEWLVNTKNITNQVYQEVEKVFEMYNINNNNSLKQFKFMRIKNRRLNIDVVNSLLFDDNV